MTRKKTNWTGDYHRVEPMLDDLVDGQLTVGERRQVEDHLAACEACREQLAALERLLEQVEALPRSVSPEADLWPPLAERLTARPRRPAAGGWPIWLRQAAAAVVFMTLGAMLSQLLAPSWRGAGGEAGSAQVAEMATPASGAEFALAETDLLRAKEALWAAVYSSDANASAETREVVERNLAVIAAAIQELRAALEADPGNPQLEDLLLAKHRSEIGLLRRLTRSAEV